MAHGLELMFLKPYTSPGLKICKQAVNLRVKHTRGFVYLFGTILKQELVDFMFSVIPSDSKYNFIKSSSKGT